MDIMVGIRSKTGRITSGSKITDEHNGKVIDIASINILRKEEKVVNKTKVEKSEYDLRFENLKGKYTKTKEVVNQKSEYDEVFERINNRRRKCVV